LTVTRSAFAVVALCYASLGFSDEKPADTSKTGERVFEQVCFACHGTGLNSAPVIGDGFDWDDRKAKGLAALLQSALNGVGYMPPRGGCLDCSDAEIEAAVKYLVSD